MPELLPIDPDGRLPHAPAPNARRKAPHVPNTDGGGMQHRRLHSASSVQISVPSFAANVTGEPGSTDTCETSLARKRGDRDKGDEDALRGSQSPQPIDSINSEQLRERRCVGETNGETDGECANGDKVGVDTDGTMCGECGGRVCGEVGACGEWGECSDGAVGNTLGATLTEDGVGERLGEGEGKS